MLKCYCHSDDFSILNTRDYLYDGINTFSYKICNNCGSYYFNNNHFNNNYNKNYYSIKNQQIKNIGLFRTLRYTSNSFFSQILRYLKPLSTYDNVLSKYLRINNPVVLDYGSGSSRYINFLKSINLIKKESYSYDPYSHDPETITKLEDVPFNKIDLVISNQVFEHLVDPKLIINEIYNLTHSKCDLIFSVPVVGSVLSTFQEYSFTLQAPDHITILSLHSWVKLLCDSKWKIVSIQEDLQSYKSYYNKSNEIAMKYETNFKVKKNNECIPDNIVFHLKK